MLIIIVIDKLEVVMLSSNCPPKLARSLQAILVALLVLLCSSCSSGRKPVYPVHGQVSFEDQPIPGALVVFHPQGTDAGTTEKSFAKTGLDGTFTLGTYEPADGAPAGNYLVTVELWLSSGQGDEGPTSRLPPRYASPNTSGLTATVETGPNELKPFELKR
jgi:hypothetical protein